MEMLELCLLLLAAVLLSSVVSQIFPKLSTPLIQIGMGLVIAFLASGRVELTLDPELFLVIFIAPLLYDEAREADIGALWRHRGAVIACAIGLVIFVTLCVGFAVNAIIPSVSLAAAFALGAALGPTDAVAVASLSKTTNIKERINSILKGEALFNDASGLVCFQFAVVFATTGAFSLANAAQSFAVAFFGGVVLGVVCGLVTNFIVARVRDMGYEDTTFNVLFELFIPFIVYLIAEHIGVGGVIAVVLCGICNASTRRTSGVALSRTSIVSSSVWKVLTFALNGIVFVLLGSQLPSAFINEWTELGMSTVHLVALVLGLTISLELARFVWCLIMELWEKPKGARSLRAQDLRDVLILTLSGAKGTITLSIMFSLPLAFENRELLVFLSCGVILCTLLLATFVVPLLAPKPKVKRSEAEERASNTEVTLDILRSVIEELAERQTTDTYAATRQVIAAYNDRIDRVKSENDIAEDSTDEVRMKCIAWQREYVYELLRKGEVTEGVAEAVLDRLHDTERIIKKDSIMAGVAWQVTHFTRDLKARVNRTLRHMPVVDPSEGAERRRVLLQDCYLLVVRKLDELITTSDPSVNTEDAATVFLEYQRALRLLADSGPSLSTIARVDAKADEIEALALRLELKYIQQALDDERIGKKTAARMRENVYLMQIDLKDRV